MNKESLGCGQRFLIRTIEPKKESMKMCKYCYNAESKNASVFTFNQNKAFAEKFGIDLTDAFNSELELARAGCIKKLDGYKIASDNGKVVFDLEPYAFLKEKAVADTVHPSLWLNGKANLEAGVFEVVKGKIYQVRGIDVANLTIVRTQNGWLVLDVTSFVESARAGIKLLEEALGENIHDRIKAVIISHSHADHFGGIKGVVAEDKVGKAEEGKIPIYVPAGFDEESVKENVYAGTAMFHRGKYQFGQDLQAGKKGRVSTGLGLGFGNGTISYIRPTDYITADSTVVIDGLEVEFQITPGTEAPAEMNNYFPEYRAFWAAENCTGTLHNLYPIRGAQLRDAANWWRFTEIALERYGKKTDVVFQSHNWPHANSPEQPHLVEEYLRNSAAIYKFIHDQTLLYANIGKTPKEIAKLITIPEHLAKAWYTRPYYGSVEINSRAVYCKYLGFYNGNPVNLNPLTEVEEAKLFVDYVGSEERVLALATEDFNAGNYDRAAKAASMVVYANPHNRFARYLCADAFEQLAYQSESGIWRNAYLSGAKELREGTQNTQKEEAAGRSDLIINMTPQMILDYLGIVTDGDQLADQDVKFRLELVRPAGESDNADSIYLGKPALREAEFLVHIYHGTVLYYEGKTEGDLPYVRTSAKILPALIGKQLERVKPFIETNCIELLERLEGAIVDLSKSSQFSLIEAQIQE